MSSPFYGEEFTFTQPDGRLLRVRGFGDQHHALFETLDGFTVVKDPVTGFYQYASVSADESDLVPTGVRAESVNPRNIGLAEGLRIKREAVKARAEMSPGLPRTKSRWEVRRERLRSAVRDFNLAPAFAPAPPPRDTVGDYVGLCLLIQFPDVAGFIPQAEVEDFCNRSGYTGFGNRGSVYDYFHEISGGRLRYTNVVTSYYTAREPRGYYTSPQIPYPERALELIKEALDDLRARGFDFSVLTSDGEDYVYALNVFYAGACVNNWKEGLWPHAHHLLTPYELMPGKLAHDYQITDMGGRLTLGTFCHENGHMVCDFPDLYDYGYESRGVGKYCLMGAGGGADRRNPTQVCAYLKYSAGWSNTVTHISAGLNAQAAAGSNDFFVHRKNATEYFIIENRQRAGRDAALPGAGLAIWHVDELGSNNNEQMTSTLHYECALVQADGRFELEGGLNNGDMRDLFRAGGNTRFADSTSPNSRWWDGTSSNLEIHGIGPDGPTMTFLADI